MIKLHWDISIFIALFIFSWGVLLGVFAEQSDVDWFPGLAALTLMILIPAGGGYLYRKSVKEEREEK
jgi:hypothetical protein